MRIGRLLVTMLVAVAALFVGTGSAQAAMDNQQSLVDGKGRTMTIQQWDTFLDGVFPLDRNRLTRSGSHSGKAIYAVVGPGASDFAGTLELGYQVGFPWSLGVGINFSYTTPNILLDDVSIAPGAFNPLGSVITPNLFPGVSISSDLGNGPGIQEVATFGGRGGPQRLGGGVQRPRHGDRRGRRGLRPFARLISKNGDSVTTHGETWGHEVGGYPASRAAAAATPSSVAVNAILTCSAPAGP